jgi:hypothetical protein
VGDSAYSGKIKSLGLSKRSRLFSTSVSRIDTVEGFTLSDIGDKKVIFLNGLSRVSP